MSHSERRYDKRDEVTLPISLSIPEPIEINGETVNYSSAGVLLLARGHLWVISTIKNKTYRGRLIRAYPSDHDATAYAIAFEHFVEATEAETRPTAAPARDSESMEPFMTPDEALAYLKINRRTLYRLLKAGAIPGVRVGRQWRLRRSELDAWLASSRSTND